MYGDQRRHDPVDAERAATPARAELSTAVRPARDPYRTTPSSQVNKLPFASSLDRANRVGPSQRSRRTPLEPSPSSANNARPASTSSRHVNNMPRLPDCSDTSPITILPPPSHSRSTASTTKVKRLASSSSASPWASSSSSSSNIDPSQLARTAIKTKRAPYQPGDGFTMDFNKRAASSSQLQSTLTPAMFRSASSSTITTTSGTRPTSDDISLAANKRSEAATFSITSIHRHFNLPESPSTPRASTSTSSARPRPPVEALATTPRPTSAPEPVPECITLASSSPPTSSPSFSTPRSNLTPRAVPSIAQRLASLDRASSSHPHVAPSVLFQLEILQHGEATSEQLNDVERKKYNAARKRAMMGSRGLEAVKGHRPPSWIDDKFAVDQLKRKMNEKEHFVANVWARDVNRSEKQDGMEMRERVIGGVDMFLLGHEFPLSTVVVLGTIVGEKYIQSGVLYLVDDGTGVLTCACPNSDPPPIIKLPADDRALLAKPSKPALTPASTRKRKLFELLDHAETSFEVGTLVRVLARVERPAWYGGERSLQVIRMEAIKDPNAFVDHHLLVHRLHQQVYSQPFDLRARLTEIKQQELAQAETLSEASSSPTNSPRKYRLPRPSKLAAADLTPQTFASYVTFFLRQHFVEMESSSHSDEDEMKTSFAPYRVARDLDAPSVRETPRPFTLNDLKRDRDLLKFATRMVQVQDQESMRRRRFRNETILNGGKRVAWVKQAAEGEVMLLAPPGSRGGSALFLDKVTKREVKEEGRLEGTRLDKAVDKAFVAALIRLRKDGVVILTPEKPVDEEGLFPNDDDDDGDQDLPDAPEWTPHLSEWASIKQKHDSTISGNAPWSFVTLSSSPPIDRYKSNAAGPGDLFDHDLTRPSKRVTKTTRSRPIGSAPWDPVQLSSSPEQEAPLPLPSEKKRSTTAPARRTDGIQTYQLVTVTSLLRPVNRIITNLYTSAIESLPARKKAREGVSVTEEQVRAAMLNDEVWCQVARKSHLVGKGIEESVKLNKVEWVGAEGQGVKVVGTHGFGGAQRKRKRKL